MKKQENANKEYTMGGNGMKKSMAVSLRAWQGALDTITWHGGRQGDLDGGTWHRGGKFFCQSDSDI